MNFATDTYETDAAYYADHTRVSASMLKVFRHSPKLYHAAYVDRSLPPSTDTPRLALGTAAHAAVLQPRQFDEIVAVAPSVDRRTKAGKAAWEDFQKDAGDRCIITDEQANLVHAMAKSVHASSLAREFVLDFGGIAEQCVTWEDPDTGLACKAKPDLWLPDSVTIVDLKTVTNSSRDEFLRSIGKYQYGIQAVHYMAGMGASRFVFITVDTQPTHDVHLYELSSDSINRLLGIRCDTLRRLADCYDSGNWHLEPTEVETLELPAWVT